MSRLLHIPEGELEVRNFHNDFLLITSPTQIPLANIGKALFQQQFDFVEEVIVTEQEICLKLNRHFQESHIDLLTQIKPQASTAIRTYHLPVYFEDHDDWENIISETGLRKPEIVSQLIASQFSVAMFGFLPGFLYLSGLGPQLHVPRKTVPAKYVEANSLAIGGKYLGLYALDSPGGWHVVGKTPISTLQLPQLPPVPLNLGDRLTLHAIGKPEYDILKLRQLTLQEYNA